jgi:hypothetical protein
MMDRIQGGKLREAFHQEAKKQFDLENGKTSLATALAANITGLYYSGTARDRAGTVFRFAWCEMVKRIRLGRRIPPVPDTWSDEYQRAASRVIWGLFCEEW